MKTLQYRGHLWWEGAGHLESGTGRTRPIFYHAMGCSCGDDYRVIWEEALYQIEELYSRHGQFAELDLLDLAAKLGYGEILDG